MGNDRPCIIDTKKDAKSTKSKINGCCISAVEPIIIACSSLLTPPAINIII